MDHITRHPAYRVYNLPHKEGGKQSGRNGSIQVYRVFRFCYRGVNHVYLFHKCNIACVLFIRDVFVQIYHAIINLMLT